MVMLSNYKDVSILKGPQCIEIGTGNAYSVDVGRARDRVPFLDSCVGGSANQTA